MLLFVRAVSESRSSRNLRLSVKTRSPRKSCANPPPHVLVKRSGGGSLLLSQLRHCFKQDRCSSIDSLFYRAILLGYALPRASLAGLSFVMCLLHADRRVCLAGSQNKSTSGSEHALEQAQDLRYFRLLGSRYRQATQPKHGRQCHEPRTRYASCVYIARKGCRWPCRTANRRSPRNTIRTRGRIRSEV